MPSDSARVSATRPFYAAYAEAYDLLITDPVEPWVEAVDARLAERAPAHIYDAGCGTGRHAAALLARGHDVELADASPDLLRIAARRCPGATAHLVDICRSPPDPRFDAVTCRGVLNDLVPDSDRAGAVQSLAGLLRPGGMLFLDIRDAAQARQHAAGTTSRTTIALPSGGRLTFRRTATWSQGTIAVREEHDFEPDGETSHQRTAYDFVMRPWSREEITDRLHGAGLTNVTIAPGVDPRRSDRLLVTARQPGCLASIPPLGTLARVISALQRNGLTPALGGSGLLVALGLAELANDWDITVDAPAGAVLSALEEAATGYRDATLRSGAFASESRYVIDGGDHEIDLLVNFALRGPSGIEELPTRVTGRWRGLPLGDPAIWLRAYRLLDRPAKAEVLERWLARP